MDELVMLDLLDAEEEAEEVVRVQRPRADAIAILSDVQFKNMFRFPKELFRIIVEVLSPHMRPTNRASDLEIPIRILIALRFFASGSYQMDVGSNLFMSVSQPTVSRCISEVSDAFNVPAIFNRFVRFPHNFEELDRVRMGFFEKYNFPGVVGCIDCTHVAIVAPPAEDPDRPGHLYINRKGFHSINVQLICDSNLKILNVKASHPGSTHDAFIWNNSNVQEVMRTIHAERRGTYFLLGDSGYPLRPWLLTPLEVEPEEGTPEHNYNCAHKRARASIERCNGVLKSRFRCLLKHRVLHYSPHRAALIINSCVVLHNICMERNLVEDLDEFDNQDINDGETLHYSGLH
ncbi:hypothetical protein PPYR_06259 [Photinus pyralis]|uniref:Putative nuclease HARBI1 n=1 Tax=Photinus pyralis TaxID=7054 RepID=A0A5N4AT76_PHOPY|nr:putative nuclease HARBI1 [Photinus pyralis]KAB0800519.1 hypothetical protein PPYR_06259 [Photinus pyralis]